MHLPSRVQWVGISFVLTISFGGYEMEALVSLSLRLGNLLKPMIGLSGNVLEQSLLCWIMFQLSWMKPFMSGFWGLKVVVMTGVEVFFFVLTSSRSSCVYLLALSICF